MCDKTCRQEYTGHLPKYWRDTAQKGARTGHELVTCALLVPAQLPLSQHHICRCCRRKNLWAWVYVWVFLVRVNVISLHTTKIYALTIHYTHFTLLTPLHSTHIQAHTNKRIVINYPCRCIFAPLFPRGRSNSVWDSWWRGESGRSWARCPVDAFSWKSPRLIRNGSLRVKGKVVDGREVKRGERKSEINIGCKEEAQEWYIYIYRNIFLFAAQVTWCMRANRSRARKRREKERARKRKEGESE